MRKDYLEKIADHLESGQLGHKVFDFNRFNCSFNEAGFIEKPQGNVCGTNGCAIGEFPILWPDLWEFNAAGGLLRVGLKDRSVVKENPFYEISHAAAFLGVSNSEAFALFSPQDEFDVDPHPWNNSLIFGSATKEEVAAHIRRFISWKEAGNSL